MPAFDGCPLDFEIYYIICLIIKDMD